MIQSICIAAMCAMWIWWIRGVTLFIVTVMNTAVDWKRRLNRVLTLTKRGVDVRMSGVSLSMFVLDAMPFHPFTDVNGVR